MSKQPEGNPRFVTCHCQHCNGEIEFDANALPAGGTDNAECPHCRMETIIFVPHPSRGAQSEPSIAPQEKPIFAPVEIVSREPQAAQRSVTVDLKLGLNPLGIASLVLGTIACVFCWIPFLGLLVVPLAAIGFLLAIIGLIVAFVNKRTGFASPITGGVLCLLSIFMALAMTGVVTGQVGAAISNIGNADTQWSKTGTVKQGNIQVTLDKVGFLVGQLNIDLRISNLSSTKKVEMTSWAAPQSEGGGATLIDNNQNTYRRNAYPSIEGLTTFQCSIYPGQTAEVILSFEKPVDNLEWLHLELPAENFGGSGMVRFEIPKSDFVH